MKAFWRGKELATVFGSAGLDENSATAALGWTLAQSPTFARALLENLFGETVDASDLRVDMQRHEPEDGGFTDIELRVGAECHVVIEAKVGWVVPSSEQFSRYAERIDAKASRLTKLVSLTAMAGKFVNLPTNLRGVSTTHRSWEDLVRLAARCRSRARETTEKLWLDQLTKHLERYMQTQDILSSLVYLVPLGTDEIEDGSGYTWIDVASEDPPRYFHPVGGAKYPRFPKVPQNYIGFRHHGMVQSVHFVEKVDVVVNLRKLHKKWPVGSDPVFLYTLGPPMTPAKEVRAGRIYAVNSHFCAIDTLLSGAYGTVADAIVETNRRRKLMRLDAIDEG